MGNWNQDNSSFTDEDMDQSLEQDKAAAAFEASGGNIGGYTFGDNYLGDGNYSPKVTDIATARSNISGLQDFYSGALPQSTYNGIMGITPKNPYGHQGFFSRVLGIDPRNIDYATGPGGIGYKNAAKVAQKKYERYTNWSGQNPQAQKQAFGSLFGNPVGEITVQGPVAQQVNLENVPIGDALAVQAGSLALGPLGYGLMSMADPFSTYVPAGSKAYNEQFDPAINKDLPTSVMGQAASRTGLGISSLADSIKDYFSPRTPAPTPTQIGSVTPSQYETRADIIARTSQHPLTGETSVPSMVSAPSSSLNAPPQYDVKVPSSLSEKSLSEKRAAIEGMIKNNYGAIPAELQTAPISPGYSSGITKSSISPTAGEQLAEMNFFERMIFENNLSPETKEIMRQKGMTVDDLLAPKQQQPGAQKPDLLNMIQGVTQTSALGRPTAGILGATQLAGGPNLYQGKYQGETGMFSPGGRGQQFYGGQQQEGFFDKFGTGVGEAMDNAYGYLSRLVT